MNLKIKMGVCAKFKLIARKASDNSIARETEWFNNLVLDSGLNRMSTGNYITMCCVGTSNTPPTTTQTGLIGFLASTTTQSATNHGAQTTASPYYLHSTVTWRFNQGVAVGNISEVGLGWGATALWNRALIKDAEGNPTTITVLSDEYLDVIAEVRGYFLESFNGSFNLLDKTGVIKSTHTYIGKPYISTGGSSGIPAKITTHALWIYTGVMQNGISIEPSGTKANISSSFIADSYPTARTNRSVTTLELTAANQTHQSFVVRYSGLFSGNLYHGYQFQISPPIIKTASDIMTYTCELSWDRYTP